MGWARHVLVVMCQERETHHPHFRRGRVKPVEGETVVGGTLYRRMKVAWAVLPTGCG